MEARDGSPAPRRNRGGVGTHYGAYRPRASTVCGLTLRQYEVLWLRALGRTQKDVAAGLGITEGTVKNLSSQAFARLEVWGLVEAMNKLGWVRIGDQYR